MADKQQVPYTEIGRDRGRQYVRTGRMDRDKIHDVATGKTDARDAVHTDQLVFTDPVTGEQVETLRYPR